MDDGSGNIHLPRLPACQLCYTRKAKCDNARPKCTPCTNGGHDCLTVSVDGTEPVPREYIYELEERINKLQGDLTVAQSPGQEPRSPRPFSEAPEPARLEHEHPEETQGDSHVVAKDDMSPNITEGAGISFMSLLFTGSRWGEQNRKLLHNLSKTTTILETAVRPNPWPSAEEALVVFNSYLDASHVQTPFLLRQYVERLYSSVFSSERPSEEVSNHDLFRTFMILAVGSVALYRSGKHKRHPYGYFLSAMNHLEPNLLSRGLDSIQDLLLVGRFGIYCHIGTSIWEINQLCTRMCIEQGLHRNRPCAPPGMTLLEAQVRRRVFWQCYMMDRYSSVMLDRPPAIADKDIQIGFPADANDDEIDTAGTAGTFTDLDTFSQTIALQHDPLRSTTEMSVFLMCLRLRKITSKIHTRFQQKAHPVSGYQNAPRESVATSGMIYEDLDELLTELERWRQTTPIFQNPKCLYESQEWHDLLLMRERLLLVRKAIDLVPKRNHIPPQNLLSLCLEYAVGTVMTFCGLFEQGKVTFTRSYFQTLFTAGLSVMFCISVLGDLDAQALLNAMDAVENGDRTLKRMVRELPDAIHYVAVYEALRADILAKMKHVQRNSKGPPLPSEPRWGGSAQYLAGGNELLNQPQFDVTEAEMGAIPEPPLQFNANWPLPTPDNSENEPVLNGSAIDTSLLSWDIFGDNIFWSMESGMLGEYVYGDPNATSLLEPSL